MVNSLSGIKPRKTNLVDRRDLDVMDYKKIIKKKAKGYYFRIDVGQNGKRKQKSFGPYRNFTEAKNDLILIKSEVLSGEYFNPSNTGFESFINKWFDTVYSIDGNTPATVKSRRDFVDAHLIPYFGPMEISKINVETIREFFQFTKENGRKVKSKKDKEREENGEKIERKPLSNAYLKQMYHLMNAAFKEAVKWELIKRNPMEFIDPPKVKDNKNKISKAWTKEELNIFLEAASVEKILVQTVTLVITGTRRGEALGLRWKDIDLEEGIITINGTLTYSEEQKLYYKPNTKSEASDNREIPIPQFLIDILKKHKQAEYNKTTQLLGKKFSEDCYVFTNDGGDFYRLDTLTKKFRRVVETLPVKNITLHGLRHTFSTLMMKLGVNAKVVKDLLGHSRVQVTLDFYSHTDMEDKRKSVEKLGEFLNA
ncbi:site-specific integrase [Filobacillus milosensis]|uniref:Site-specific integrase n=1 Tax=Filobacillus milosensis TaxID=94137 RepID=A0A4Y8IHE0_9BACI|nr:tyrosine-type recombinase/integrase [Filobacillus milosensis]TFB14113.1 site-specific integrase [Filobacillus milosensis]